MRDRLDKVLHGMGLVFSRSQAENLIRLGKVTVNGSVETKSGRLVGPSDKIVLNATEQYVSRAGLKLASVAQIFKLDFRGKTVLDVGSSTGGFTDYALQHGAAKVVAVDVGTDQLHPSLRGDSRIELHERTDIRNIRLKSPTVIPTEAEGSEQKRSLASSLVTVTGIGDGGLVQNFKFQILDSIPDIVVVDVSFISLRDVLPHVSSLMTHDSLLAAMVKPQFEAGREQINKGVIKNDTIRREILRNFEVWSERYVVILNKADSEVAGTKGNRERFYLMKIK